MNYSTLIFDFDGTLADTLDEGVKIYNTLAEKYGLLKVEAEDIPSLQHMTIGRLFDHLGISKHRAPKILYQATRMLKSRIAHLPMIQGMADALPILMEKTAHLGILTSNSVDNVNLFLDSHGLDGVFSFVSSTSKLTGKARHLRSIQKTYELDSARMIYIGDEIRDIRAGKKAGLAVAAVSWGFNSLESLQAEDPNFMFHHPEELHTLVGSFG